MSFPLKPWRWWVWLYATHSREVMAGIALLVVVAAGVTAANTIAINHANAARIADNHMAQVVQCQNGNESREANRILWSFVLDSAERSAPPEKTAQVEAFKVWVVTGVFPDHDCSDLSRAYPVPPPPSIPAG